MRLKQELSLSSVMTFGKYRGLTVEEVIEEDPDYIEWAMDEAGIELDQEAADKLDYMVNAPNPLECM